MRPPHAYSSDSSDSPSDPWAASSAWVCGLRGGRVPRGRLRDHTDQQRFESNEEGIVGPVYGRDAQALRAHVGNDDLGRTPVRRQCPASPMAGRRWPVSLRGPLEVAKLPLCDPRLGRSCRRGHAQRVVVCPLGVDPLFARVIVGWRVSTWMRTDLVLDALEQALHDRRSSERAACRPQRPRSCPEEDAAGVGRAPRNSSGSILRCPTLGYRKAGAQPSPGRPKTSRSARAQTGSVAVRRSEGRRRKRRSFGRERMTRSS